MRTRRTMRVPRAAQLAAGALIFVLPSSAYALTSGQTGHRHHRRHVLRAWLLQDDLAYGRDTIVKGTTAAGVPRAAVTLQYRAARTRGWRPVAAGRAAADGHFTLHAPIDRSGVVRVIERAAERVDELGLTASLAGAGPIEESRPARVQVAAGFEIADGSIGGLAGSAKTIDGRLLPGAPGRLVRLLAGSGSNWTTLAQARTGRSGGFGLRFALPGGAVRALRVTFAGDRANRGATANAGNVVGFTASVASWYYDGGNTACGFHAHYGVANRTLPCGAHVTLSYGGRTVVTTVDDRGPYVAGRDYDLDQNTAAALGMYGVATVLASV